MISIILVGKRIDKNRLSDDEIDRRENQEKTTPSSRLLYLFLLLLKNSGEIKKKELIKELGITNRTFKKYRSFINEFLKEKKFFHEDKLNLDKEKSKDNGPIRIIKKDEEEYVVLNPFEKIDAVNEYNSIISIFFAKSILQTLNIKELNEKINKIYTLFLTAIIRKSDIRSFLNNLNRIFYYHPYAPKDYTDKTEIINNIIQGIFHKKKIKCEYSPLVINNYQEKIMKKYILEPYSIVCHMNALYLIARCEDSKIRMFAIDRFESVSHIGDSYKYPNLFEYEPKNFLNAFIGVIGEGEKRNFEIIFKNNPALKKTIKERKWFENQVFKEIPDGRLRMSFTTPISIELLRWINSWGDDIEHITPSIKEIKEELYRLK